MASEAEFLVLYWQLTAAEQAAIIEIMKSRIEKRKQQEEQEEQ
jgi:hypothetical protein